MNKSSIVEDLVLALAGSTLFWVTLAGIAIRRLRIDFAKLEQFLEDLFTQMDEFTYDAFHLARIAVSSTLSALYGASISSALVTILVVSFVLNLSMIFWFYSDWLSRKEEIISLERQVITTVDREYGDLFNTESGRRKLDYADEIVVMPEGGVANAHNNEESVRLRMLADDHAANVHHYIATNNITYEIMLASLFGNGEFGFDSQIARLLYLTFILFFMIASTAIIDTTAVYFTFILTDALSWHSFRKALGALFAVLTCFLLALINYIEVLRGEINVWFKILAVIGECA